MKKRQKIRNFFLIISFLLFPITQFYFSPYLILWGASEGIITASFFTFALLLFGAIVTGRSFCGWIMPCGGMQEIFSLFNNKKPKTGKLDFIKFVIWIPWLMAILILFMLAGGYKETDYFFHLENGISVSNVYMYVPYYGVILIFLLISLIFGRRANCHYICWMSPFMIMGRSISNCLYIPSLRLKSDKSKCINCKICNRECPMSLDVNAMVKKANMENVECILCGKCVDSCPKEVIGFYFGSLKKC